MDIKDLANSANPCFYFSLTDRDPKESYNAPPTPPREKAFDIIRGARLVRPEAAQPAGPVDSEQVSTPGVPFEVRFPKGGWVVQQRRERGEGSGVYYMFSDAEARMSASFYVEPASKCRTAADCRALYWSNPGPVVRDPQGVRQFEKGPFAIVSFVVPEFQGVKVNQLSYSAHAVYRGFWIDMHLSTVSTTADREEALSRFVDGVTFVEK